MQSFEQFAEAKDDTYQLKAVMDLAAALQGVFKKYSINTRREAWSKITSKKGEEYVQQLLRNPEHTLSQFRTLAG